LGDFASQGIANSIWAFATLSHKPSGGVLERFEEEIYRKLGDFASQGIANSIWAFATLGHKPSVGVLKRFEEEIDRKLGDFNSQDIAISIWAFATLGHGPSPKLMQRFEEEIDRKLGDFNSQHISNVLLGFASLDYVPTVRKPALLSKMEGRVADMSHSMPEQHIANSSWSLAVLDRGRSDREYVQALASAVQRLFASDPRNFSEPEWTQIWQADRWLASREGSPRLLTAESLAYAEDFLRKRGMAATATTSQLQKNVAKVLQSMGVAHTVEHLLLDGLVSADIYIEASNTIVEVDGPSHFATNDLSRPLGHTVFRNRLHQVSGFNVAQVPYWEWDKLTDESSRAAYLARKLRLGKDES